MMRLCPKDGIKTEQERCPECGTATLVLAQNPESKLAEGTEVNGRYRIDKMIGQGGFGAVYKATHLATDQEMAIKVLGISLDSDESDLIQRFFAEAQITAGLKHPNTIRVFDFGQTEGGALYIAMELLNGADLNDLLKMRKETGEAMSEEETVRIASQTLRSLAEAHMAGLVHRDLKPHNIFLNEVPGDDPVVKVLDFGIAKRLGSNLTGTGQAFGTPNYMSPEQAQNRPIDARSDLYSLGVVMFQCVTMRCPFEGDNPLAVLLSHVTDQPPDLREVASVPLSEEFIQIVEKALAKDPFQRFEGAIEMRKALTSIGRVSRETMVSSSDAPRPAQAPLHTPSAPTSVKKETFASTDHGKKLALDDAATDDATQAYHIRQVTAQVTESGSVKVDSTQAFAATDIAPSRGPSGQSPAPVTAPPSGPPSSASGDQPAVTMDGSGSGYTEAFMGLGDKMVAQAQSARAPVEDPVEVAVKSKSGKGVMVLVALVVLAAAGVGFALLGKSGGEKEKAPPAAVAQAGQEEPGAASGDNGAAAAAPAAEEDAGGDEEQDAGQAADAGSAEAEDTGGGTDAGAAAGASDGVVAVKLTTDPPGASVIVQGATLGKTPLTLKVERNKPLTGNLTRAGYHNRDFFVLHTDAPAKTYTLNKKVVKVIGRPKRPKTASPSRPKPSRPAPSTSALEERL